MINWLFETFIATTMLMLVVLAIRGPVANRFGTRAAYWLWLAPALRMLMPPLPESVVALPVTNVQQAAIILVGASSPAHTAMAPASSHVPIMAGLVAIWLVGAALFLLYHLTSYRQFVRKMRQHAEPMAVRGPVRISASPLVSSPLAYGIIGRAIVIPHDFKSRFDPTEQRLAIVHELTHHRRGDLWTNAAALVMLALHWFNPIAHFAHRAFRLDQEAACDAIVLRHARPEDRQAYGKALLKAAMGPVPLGACAMSTASMLKSRLSRIARLSPKRNMVRVGAIAVPVLALAGALATASHGIAAPEAPPSAVTPRMIVIGGGMISGPQGDAIDRTVESEINQAAEQAETISGQVKSAVADALAEAETALQEAESAMSDADAARIEAQSARAAADQARAAADRAGRRADAVAPPAPPLPPLPPAAADAPTPPAPPAPPALAETTKVKCPDHNERRVIKTRQRVDGKADAFTMVICIPSKRAIKATVRDALTSARSSIAAEPMLDKRARDEALAALDREIRDLDQ